MSNFLWISNDTLDYLHIKVRGKIKIYIMEIMLDLSTLICVAYIAFHIGILQIAF